MNVLYICSQEDPSRVFGKTEEGFLKRVAHVQKAGFATDIRKDLDTLAKVEEYIRTHYPNGLDGLYFRAHGNQEQCVLSSAKSGKISMTCNHEEKSILKRIFRAVKPGGFLITESCHNGNGRYNLLKYIAQYCHPDVLVIGNRGGPCDVEFCPGQPKHHRYIWNDKDQTRIYYQTKARKPVNISIRKLNALQKLLGKTPKGLDFCYRFLGERKNPEELPCVLEDLKVELKTVRVSMADVSKKWQTILSLFAKQVPSSNLESLEIDPAYRLEDLDLLPDRISKIQRPDNQVKCAWMFLLGMAIVADHREVFALLEGEETAYGPIAQCIHALSNLAVHASPNGSILETFDEHLLIIQNSFLLAKEKHLLSDLEARTKTFY